MSDLLTLAVDGHGGLDRWRRIESLTATVTAGGALFAFKGHQDGLRAVQATADTAVPRLTFAPFAGSVEGRFASGQVAVTARDGTERHRDNPRAAFTDLAPDAPWDDLHLLYFSGYAMWNYLCAPFFLTWPGFTCAEVAPWTERTDQGTETWRRLHVTFPAGVPTHSTEQTFYFDDAGLIRRLDYTPDVVDRTVVAAHYCEAHQSFSGLTVPTRRRVYGRRDDGTPDRALPLVEIDISEVTVRP